MHNARQSRVKEQTRTRSQVHSEREVTLCWYVSVVRDARNRKRRALGASDHRPHSTIVHILGCAIGLVDFVVRTSSQPTRTSDRRLIDQSVLGSLLHPLLLSMPNLQPEKYFRESARKTFTRRKSAAEEESRLSRRSSGPRSPVTAGAVAGGEVDAVALQCDIDCVFETAAIKRRAVGPKDVQIDVKYCGVCHSDLTFAVRVSRGRGTT